MTGAPTALICEAEGFADQARGLSTRRSRVTNAHLVMVGSAILLLPNLLLAWHLKPFPATIMLLGGLAFAAQQARPSILPGSILAKPLAVPRLFACLILASALLVLGGEGHLVFTNWDWLTRDAVFADLVREPFPPTYQVGGETLLLRAPLGMYMLPAIVAKATSLGVGHAALLVQNAVLLTLILYMLATIAGRRASLTIVVFLSFSGLDVVGQLVMWLKNGHSIASFTLPSHIENWSLQYSSVITQLFWVPNHALPSYWLVLIVLLCTRREATLGDLGLAMAATLFWSPFAVIGTLPLAACLFVREARPALAAPRFWLAAATAMCFLPVALYMQVDAAKVPHAFILFAPAMAATIVLFLMVEIPHVAIVREVWSEITPSLQGILAVSIGFLIVLPTVRLGAANDLVMRASIPALMILSIAFAEALSISWPKRPMLLAAGLALMLVGAVTPAQEFIRALTFAPFTISNCNIVTVWKKIAPQYPTFENYLARIDRLPDGLMSVPQKSPLIGDPTSICWPDLPYDPNTHIGRSSNADIRRQAASPRDPI